MYLSFSEQSHHKEDVYQEHRPCLWSATGHLKKWPEVNCFDSQVEGVTSGLLKVIQVNMSECFDGDSVPDRSFGLLCPQANVMGFLEQIKKVLKIGRIHIDVNIGTIGVKKWTSQYNVTRKLVLYQTRVNK